MWSRLLNLKMFSLSAILQVAWPLIGNYSCDITMPSCARASNQGWRYFLFTMGALMLALWAIQFFAFSLYESPKYLMGKEMDEHAVEVVHRIAQYNRKTSSLSLENLQSIDKEYHKKESSDGKRKIYGSTSRTLSIYLFLTGIMSSRCLLHASLQFQQHFLLYYGVSISKFRNNDLMLSCISIHRARLSAVRKDLT